MSACMIDGSIFGDPIDARSAPIICGNIYSNAVNAGFKLATGAEGIGFSQGKCRCFSTSFFDMPWDHRAIRALGFSCLLLSAGKRRQFITAPSRLFV
jgi:hypothetical protein